MRTITVTYESEVMNNFIEALIIEFNLDFQSTWCHKDILGLETHKQPEPDKLKHYYITYEIYIHEDKPEEIFAAWLLKKYINFMLDNNMKLEVDEILDEVFADDKNKTDNKDE